MSPGLLPRVDSPDTQHQVKVSAGTHGPRMHVDPEIGRETQEADTLNLGAPSQGWSLFLVVSDLFWHNVCRPYHRLALDLRSSACQLQIVVFQLKTSFSPHFNHDP